MAGVEGVRGVGYLVKLQAQKGNAYLRIHKLVMAHYIEKKPLY